MRRSDYMEHRVSFEEYYQHIAELAGISFDQNDDFIPNCVIPALKKGDKHLNTIPLRWWDAMSMGNALAINKALSQVEGETYSLALGVCVMKSAARKAALKIMEEHEKDQGD